MDLGFELHVSHSVLDEEILNYGLFGIFLGYFDLFVGLDVVFIGDVVLEIFHPVDLNLIQQNAQIFVVLCCNL